MSAKHPVLTFAGIWASAVAISVGMFYFEVSNQFAHPTLPFEDGDRVVLIENRDMERGYISSRSLADFAAWRAQLASIEDLGVMVLRGGNLVTAEGHVDAVTAVEATAAVFRVSRIPPLLGRPLLEADEGPGGDRVTVIRESLWESAFARDPEILGQTVEHGGESWTIVGVMPNTFALPLNHEMWVPLRLVPERYDRGTGPAIRTIGRLAPGASQANVQVELDVIGARLRAESPTADEQLVPRVQSYPLAVLGDENVARWLWRLNAVFLLLLVVICANLGSVVYARATTREGELTVRVALGASRLRIVSQFFVEALLLTSIGAAIAVLFVQWGLRAEFAFFAAIEESGFPFWWHTELSPVTLIYVGLLTLLGALVTGVLPALKITGGGIRAGLMHRAGRGGGGRSRHIYTAAIVAQVALSGALIPVGVWATRLVSEYGTELDIATEEYLVAEFSIARSPEVSDEDRSIRLDGAYETMRVDLASDSRISGITFVDRLPGETSGTARIEVEDSRVGSDVSELHTVRMASVGEDFFDVMEIPVLDGRGFEPGDDPGSGVGGLIVNEPFVQRVLGGRNAVGQRIRYWTAGDPEPRPWHEIVGVVPDLAMNPFEPARGEGIYRLAQPSEVPYPFLIARTSGDLAVAPQILQRAAVQADPDLTVYDVHNWREVRETIMRATRRGLSVGLLVVFFIVFLSSVVTFALMSLAVSRRTREIGVRKALGATGPSVLASVFSRAGVQLGVGGLVGAVLSVVGLSYVESTVGFNRGAGGFIEDPLMCMAILALLAIVALASCGVPALRALRIAPTEAMRQDI